MVMLWNNGLFPRIISRRSVVCHHECLATRNAHDYMHNWLQHYNRSRNHRKLTLHTVLARRGYTASCVAPKKNIVSYLSSQAEKLEETLPARQRIGHVSDGKSTFSRL